MQQDLLFVIRLTYSEIFTFIQILSKNLLFYDNVSIWLKNTKYDLMIQ